MILLLVSPDSGLWFSRTGVEQFELVGLDGCRRLAVSEGVCALDFLRYRDGVTTLWYG